MLGWVEKVKGLSKQRKKLTGGPDISLWVTRGKGGGEAKRVEGGSTVTGDLTWGGEHETIYR